MKFLFYTIPAFVRNAKRLFSVASSVHNEVQGITRPSSVSLHMLLASISLLPATERKYRCSTNALFLALSTSSCDGRKKNSFTVSMHRCNFCKNIRA
uniref:Secreted protein n=1 Tax=Parascaris univalens TaxID=6257 RepID=A0A915B8T5_PARUN